jgi:2'-hydroxyisoflavone reductase
MDETGPVETLPAGEEQSEEVKRHYGALKALSEKAAEAAMPGRVAAVRPGLIVGPTDPTDRFTYWPVRLSRGGEAVAPGDGADPVQLIDVRDLAAWIIEVVERRHLGTFNALGPAQTLTMGELVEASAAASPAPATPVWIPADFLHEQEVSAWGDMPVWVPRKDSGFAQLPNEAAVARGLRFRPIAETAKDTLAWYRTLPEERRQGPLRAGISPEREQQVLAAFRAQKG